LIFFTVYLIILFTSKVIIRTYGGKLRNPVSRRYLCVKNNDLL